MDRIAFWKLLDSSRNECLFDTNKRMAFLYRHLSILTIQELIGFQKNMNALIELAHSSNLIEKAKTALNNFICDDNFEHFVCWLILQGSESFHQSIQELEALLQVIEINYKGYGKNTNYWREYDTQLDKVQRIPSIDKFLFFKKDLLILTSIIYQRGINTLFDDIMGIDYKNIDKESIYVILRLLTYNQQWKELRLISDKTIVRFPDYHVGYIANGYANFHLNNTEITLSSVNKGIEIKRNSDKSYILRIKIFTKMSQIQMAINDLTQLLLSSQKITYFFHRADLYIKTNQFILAMNDIEKARKMNSDWSRDGKKEFYLLYDKIMHY